MEFKRDAKTVIVKGVVFFVAMMGASAVLYMQEGGWEWRNTLIWLVGFPVSLYIFLTVFKTNVYLGEVEMEYHRLFHTKTMRYDDIASIELTTSSSNDSHDRNSYFVLRDQYGKKMRFNRAIMSSHDKSYRFLNHIRSKNASVHFDYSCLAILGDRNPRMDFKEAVVYILDEYKKRR